jgi:DNA invertase Pin-like site-specific DNA recombinase
MFALTPTRKTAVGYYRHSAEDKQENSVLIQREHAQKFALQYDMDLIHEEADEGKSGLSANRPAFDRLINEWVLNPESPHLDYVLVYDVSRWGRFQDPDEAAYYEMLCKKRGIKVIYISRGFPKEEMALLNQLQTPIERYMAAEYSRQLSEKVWSGSMKVSEQGFSAGGTAPYGMSRVLLDENKREVGLLEKGQHKVISNQRVTLTPTGDQATEAVKGSFELLINHWHTPEEIAEYLNEKGIPSAGGGEWTKEKVVRILTNETYTGSRIYNKTWGRLKQKKRPNPREEWVVKENAFPAIVDTDVFMRAQEHLYWLMPFRWKRGGNTIKRVQQSVHDQLFPILENHEDFDELYLHGLKKNLPIVYGVTYYREGIPHVCFSITEEMKKYGFVLGISLQIYRKEPVDRFFLLPTEKFDIGYFLVVSQADDAYRSYLLEPGDVQERLLALIKPKKPADNVPADILPEA